MDLLPLTAISRPKISERCERVQPLAQTVLQSPRLNCSAGATPGSSATSLSKPEMDEGTWSTFVDGAVGWWSQLWGHFPFLSAPPLSDSKESAIGTGHQSL